MKVSTVKAFITSKDYDLKPLLSVKTSQPINIPARSIITLVGSLD
jgi:hypothetical protein